MEFDKKIIGNRIRMLRLENKMTQETLALLIGLKGKSSIANYEAGKIIPSDKIKLKLCDVFNCPIEYLMGISDERINFDFNNWEKKSKENEKKYKEELKNKGKSDIRNPITIDEDKINLAFSSGYSGLNETNKNIINATIAGLLAKQKSEESEKKEKK